jgi:heat shock protein HslJ
VRLLAAVLLASLGLVAAGCGSDATSGAGSTSAATTASPEDVAWVLTSGLDVAGWEDTPPTVTFSNGVAGGFSGCNRYTGHYVLDGSKVTITEVGSTQIACDSPRGDVERAYTDAFAKVRTWSLDGDALVLGDDGGKELLRFEAASPRGSWTATSVRLPGSVSSIVEGTEITAVFGADGTVTGSAGCNTYTATYSQAGNRTTISAPASTRKACSDPEGVVAQEAAYLAALPTTGRFEVAGGGLTLLRPDGTTVATFAAK